MGYAYFSVGWDEHAVRANPEWAMRDADGQPIRRGAPESDQVTGRWTYLCVNSPYRDYALGQIAEIVQGYDFPALFLDILFLNPSGQVCHCAHCRARWALDHTEPLPSTFTPAYLQFAIETLGRFQRDVKRLAAHTGREAQSRPPTTSACPTTTMITWRSRSTRWGATTSATARWPRSCAPRLAAGKSN